MSGHVHTAQPWASVTFNGWLVTSRVESANDTPPTPWSEPSGMMIADWSDHIALVLTDGTTAVTSAAAIAFVKHCEAALLNETETPHDHR